MENVSISNTIHTIQDIMRIDEGMNGDAQRLSQLTWMIFLKSFDYDLVNRFQKIIQRFGVFWQP
jgi:hypothetical protein